MIKRLNPRNVILVHGEKNKMDKLKQFIESDMKIPTFVPANDTKVVFNDFSFAKCKISYQLAKQFSKGLRMNQDLRFNAVLTKSSETGVGVCYELFTL